MIYSLNLMSVLFLPEYGALGAFLDGLVKELPSAGCLDIVPQMPDAEQVLPGSIEVNFQCAKWAVARSPMRPLFVTGELKIRRASAVFCEFCTLTSILSQGDNHPGGQQTTGSHPLLN